MKSKFPSDITFFHPKEFSLALIVGQVFWQQILSVSVYLEVSLFRLHFLKDIFTGYQIQNSGLTLSHYLLDSILSDNTLAGIYIIVPLLCIIVFPLG